MWSYRDAWPEVREVIDHVSFEPDKAEVNLDGKRLALEPGQSVSPHGVDRGTEAKTALFDRRAKENPARRIGTVADIADAVVFALTNTFLTASRSRWTAASQRSSGPVGHRAW